MSSRDTQQTETRRGQESPSKGELLIWRFNRKVTCDTLKADIWQIFKPLNGLGSISPRTRTSPGNPAPLITRRRLPTASRGRPPARRSDAGSPPSGLGAGESCVCGVTLSGAAPARCQNVLGDGHPAARSQGSEPPAQTLARPSPGALPPPATRQPPLGGAALALGPEMLPHPARRSRQLPTLSPVPWVMCTTISSSLLRIFGP